jgi:hypothetical protein
MCQYHMVGQDPTPNIHLRHQPLMADASVSISARSCFRPLLFCPCTLFSILHLVFLLIGPEQGFVPQLSSVNDTEGMFSTYDVLSYVLTCMYSQLSVYRYILN